MIIRYIGNFPPPYGGVTRKNQLLYEIISEKYKVVRLEKIGVMPEKIYQACNILLAILHKQVLIIGISSKGGKSRFLTKLLYYFNRYTMQRSLYFMMGGTEARRIAEHTNEIEWYRNYKQIYVETSSMVKCLEAAGLKNVSLFPNCRRRPAEQIRIKTHDDGRLRCVFFSLVQEMKGVDLILETAEHLTEVDFFIYGPIDPDFEQTFREHMQHLSNVRYQGIFSGNNEETYQELGKYDILLFPSKWKTEGVPGVIVEAKIAGIPAVVSNVSYNADLVSDGIEGVVLKENSSDELIKALTEIYKDRKKIYNLKKESLQSAEKFYIDNYIECIFNMMSGGGYLTSCHYICVYGAVQLLSIYKEVTVA